MNKFIEFIESQDVSNKFKENKKEWLLDDENNGYIKDKTKITYWRLFNSSVFDLEDACKKDLRKFTSIEIMNLIKGAVTNSMATKRVLYSAINNYLIYCVERGHSTYNQCDVMSTESLFEVNAKALKNNYMEIDEFYKYLDELSADAVEKMVFILVRYGCPTKFIPSVRWDDVNEEEKTIKVMVKDKVIFLPIDDEFIRRVKLAKVCEGKSSVDGRTYREYFDIGYILKNIRPEIRNTTSIYNVLEQVAKNSKKQRVDLGVLYKNRRYDFIQDIYNENGTVETVDLKNILEFLGVNSSPTQLTAFKKEIKDILDIEVENMIKSNPIQIINVKTGELLGAYESASKIQDCSMEEFGFFLDKSLVGKIAKGERKATKGLTFRYLE